MIEYWVVSSNQRDDFEVEVAGKLNNGWSLVGGLVVVREPAAITGGHPMSCYFYQALIKGSAA